MCRLIDTNAEIQHSVWREIRELNPCSAVNSRMQQPLCESPIDVIDCEQWPLLFPLIYTRFRRRAGVFFVFWWRIWVTIPSPPACRAGALPTWANSPYGTLGGLEPLSSVLETDILPIELSGHIVIVVVPPLRPNRVPMQLLNTVAVYCSVDRRRTRMQTLFSVSLRDLPSPFRNLFPYAWLIGRLDRNILASPYPSDFATGQLTYHMLPYGAGFSRNDLSPKTLFISPIVHAIFCR